MRSALWSGANALSIHSRDPGTFDWPTLTSSASLKRWLNQKARKPIGWSVTEL